MNLRLLTSFPRAAIGLLCAYLAGPAALAQPAPTVPLPKPPALTGPATAPAPLKLTVPSEGIKTNASPSPGEFESVNRFIKEATAILAKGDDTELGATAAATARNELINASSAAKGASVPYLTNYLGTLAAELSRMIASPNVRVRVNAGIVAARVAENTKPILPATQFQKTILAAMQDPCDAVALWGVKGAGSMLSAPGQAAPTAAVLNQIPDTVKAHKLSGPITDEAYTALRDTFDAYQLTVGPANQQIVAKLLEVFTLRADSYKASLPPDPSIDRRPCSFLTTQTGMWKVMTPVQQQQVMGLISQVLTLASTAATTTQLPAESFEQLRVLLTDTCKAVSVVGTAMSNAPLSLAALAASKQLANANTPADNTTTKRVRIMAIP